MTVPDHPPLNRPLQQRIAEQRAETQRLAREYGVTNLAVFRSVARGEETDASDIDLLADPPPDLGLFQLARMERDLSALLQARVEVVPAQDLKPGVKEKAQAESVAL